MESGPKNYYTILGLQAGASDEEIKAAYRRLTKAAHPDSNHSLGGDDSLITELNEAYRVLGNAERRLEYDIAMVSAKVPAAVAQTQVDRPVEIKISAAELADRKRTRTPRASHTGALRWAALLCGVAVVAAVGFWALVVVFRSTSTKLAVGTIFSDCSECPSMVVVPPGTFLMGAASNDGSFKSSVPQHLVTISRPFAVGRFLVTNEQYAEFLTAMLREGSYDQRWVQTDRTASDSHLMWRVKMVLAEPGFEKHPVNHVSWPGAKAYAQWLSSETGQPYRLLSETEWEYAARGGTQTKFYFGDDILKACEYANTADYTYTQHHSNEVGIRCTDGYSETSPVGVFKSNAFGLFDMIGNVWEWTEDCWHDNYDGAPVDGSPWVSGEICKDRVLRGQSFNFANWGEGVAKRSQWDANGELNSIGLRVARAVRP